MVLYMCVRPVIRCFNCMCRIRDGLKHILAISRLGNGHMQLNKPWLMIKGNPQQMYADIVQLVMCD